MSLVLMIRIYTKRNQSDFFPRQIHINFHDSGCQWIFGGSHFDEVLVKWMKLYCPLFSHWQWKKMIEMFCSISFPDGGLSNSTSRTTALSCPIFSPISNKQHPLHQPDPSSRAHWTNSKRLINNGTSALLMKVLIIIKASEQELKKKLTALTHKAIKGWTFLRSK